MSKYLIPKNYFVFKKIFGEHPHLLKSFLNAVLPLEEESKIETLEYLQADETPEIPILKDTYFNVKCTDKEGRIFIVEIKMEWTDYVMWHHLFETEQVCVKQLKPGTSYKLPHPVYGLGLLDAIFDRETPVWYHHYRQVKLIDAQSEIIKGLTLVFVELPKFVPSTQEDKRLQVLWFRFMQEINEKTRKPDPVFQEVPEIMQALDLAEWANFTDAELYEYEGYWNAVSYKRTLIEGSYNKGLKKGIKESIIEGRKEGIIDVEIQIAKSMLNQYYSKDLISEATGLSYKEIEKLRTNVSF